MNKSKHRVFFAAMGIFVLGLGGFIFLQERVVLLGEEVILATRPIDPRDLFRGEYVILRYDIEDHEYVQPKTSRDTPDKDGYVKLVVGDDGVADVIAYQDTKPDFSTGIWLKGEVDTRRIRFPNLEQYFVPEGAGRPIERMRTGLHVRVSVYKGEGRVVGLLDENLEEIDPYDYRE